MEETLLNQIENEVKQNEESSLLGVQSDNASESNTETSLVESSPLDSVNNSLDENINTFSSSAGDEMMRAQREALEIEMRKKYFSNPENQADILLNNYVKSSQILINHNERRRLRREFLKNAKKGMYRKIFNEQIYGISKEESQRRFEKLNG